MKSVIIALLAAATLAACAKKEEAPAPTPTPAPVVAPATPVSSAASEPAKTEEAKK